MWKQLGLFSERCAPCPRWKWCARSTGQQCFVPDSEPDLAHYWSGHTARVKRIGGMEPQALPAVKQQPQLPRIIHVHPDQGFASETELDGTTLGIYSKRAVLISHAGCPLNERYLRSRGLSAVRKVLLLGGKDRWLRGFSRGVGNAFFESVTSANIHAIVCPNYSAYEHVEHWVWLDNRAIGQQFMRLLLERALPGVFHTYLEDSPVHVEWLTEYMRLNPTQHFIATGFDRGGANNAKFVARRLEMLAEVEQRVGRPLHFVLSNLLTRLGWVKELALLFPGRAHLVAQSVFLRSVAGSVLTIKPDGRFDWRKRAYEYDRGITLFRHNSEILERTIGECCPDFFTSGVVRRPHFADFSPQGHLLQRYPRSLNQGTTA